MASVLFAVPFHIEKLVVSNPFQFQMVFFLAVESCDCWHKLVSGVARIWCEEGAQN